MSKKSSMLQLDAATRYFQHEEAMQCIYSTHIINLLSISTSEIFYLSTYLSIYLSVCLSIYLSIYLYIYIYIYIYSLHDELP